MRNIAIFSAVMLSLLSSRAQEYQMVTFGGQTFRSEVIEVDGKKYPVGDMGAHGNQIRKFPKDTILDRAKVECIFSHTVYDPEIEKKHEYFYMLLSGNRYSWYRAYQRYQIDSLVNHRDRDTITNKLYNAIWRRFETPNNGGPETNLKNHITGEIETYDFFGGSGYICTEPRINFDWTLEDDTTTVCGHPCHKATCSFRGREWTAWYADDISQSDGPWKFSGLPGLILHIEDSKQEHVFTAATVRPGGPDGLVRGGVNDHAFKAKREWMLKAKRETKENPTAALKAAGLMPKNLDGTDMELPKKRLYIFNPIEKE